MSASPLKRASWVCLAASAVQGCSWMHHDPNKVEKCREPALPAAVLSIPLLQAPPGLDPPDTRNAVKIPELTSPDTPRSPKDPCLSKPPSYQSS